MKYHLVEERFEGAQAIYDADTIGQISDGYHTFDELYKHRCLLFRIVARNYHNPNKVYRFHHYEGWFCLGIEMPFGQVSYHLPESEWDKCAFAQERQPEFDGHTSDDVLKRLAMMAGE